MLTRSSFARVTHKRLYHFFINKDVLRAKQNVKEEHDVTNVGNKDEVNLLLDHGLIHLQKTGYYHYLPLGTRMIGNITKIIDKEFQKFHPSYALQKLELCSSSPLKFWETTSRYPKNKAEVFEFLDNNTKRLLNPTCEEDITSLFKNLYKANKPHSLPLALYQTTKKYRNEKRPRLGLVRTKEFIMNDCYSFHTTIEDSSSFFNLMRQKYVNIFQKLNLPVILAKADSGDIGGEESVEYQYISEKGEDTLLTCSSCKTGFNIEQFGGKLSESKHEKIVDGLSYKLCWTHQKDSLVAIYYPVKETLSLEKIEEELGDKVDLESFTSNNNETIIDFINNQENLQEYLFNLPIVRMIDLRVNKRGNLPDWPFKIFSKYQFMNMDKIDLCKPRSGDYDCPECGHEESINVSRSIEVGHIFNLGDRYTSKNNFNVFTENNTPVYMGCYGIGVSRLLQILVSHNQDALGCNFPVAVAPYKVNFLINNYKNDQLDEETIAFIEKIIKDKFEKDYYLDLNKNIKHFDKCKISNAIGVPITVLVNGKHSKLPIIEVEIRGDIVNGNWATLIEQAAEQKGDFKVLRETKEGSKLPLFKLNHNDIFNVLPILLQCIR